jgi:NADPH:quinone reductase-like Zn-dependent oxidoreductase
MTSTTEYGSVPRTMRAWRYTSARGGLENAIELVDAPIPSTWRKRKPGWELVQVESMAFNPADYKLPETPWLSWLLTPKPAIPGLDFAGKGVGGALDQKRVFGRLDLPYQHGSLAQFVLAKSEGVAELPEGVSFEDAAALSTGAMSAYRTIVPYIRPGRGDRVFINGGSGGVGTFSIQIAKLLGCYVVASCSDRNVDLCKSLGADEVINYTQVDAGDVGTELVRRVREGQLQPFDLAVDNVGHDPGLHSKSEVFLSNSGVFVLLAAMDGSLAGISSMLSSWLRPQWLGGVPRKWKFVLAYNDPQAMAQIRDWVAEGKLRSIIDETFSFEDAPSAIKKIRTGRARGKVVVTGISN